MLPHTLNFQVYEVLFLGELGDLTVEITIEVKTANSETKETSSFGFDERHPESTADIPSLGSAWYPPGTASGATLRTELLPGMGLTDSEVKLGACMRRDQC